MRGPELARQFKFLSVSLYLCLSVFLDQFDRGGEIHQECGRDHRLEFQTEYERESQLKQQPSVSLRCSVKLSYGH